MSDAITYNQFFQAAADGLTLGPDRHPKWQRVEPGTVIPAGQPYRTESRSGLFIDGATSCEFANGQPEPLKVDSLYDGAEYTMRVDSSWKPPLVLPTEPGSVVKATRGNKRRLWMRGGLNSWIGENGEGPASDSDLLDVRVLFDAESDR